MPYFEIQLTPKLQRVYDIVPDTVIGRGPQCQIQLLSRAVSRRHARVEFGDQGEAIISDLGTKNGIKLNGQRIQGAAVIGEGDVLVVGDVSMVFRAAGRLSVAADALDFRDRPPAREDLPRALMAQASFLIRADAGQIATFQQTIARARIERLEFDETTRFKLQIALKEALDNARAHGSRGDRARTICVTFSEDPEEFLMQVKDEGPGYDFEQRLAGAVEVDALEAIRNRPALGAGLGLRIILNCIDRLQFEGRGAAITMGKFKEGGQIFVISDESDLGATGDADPMAITSDDEDDGAGEVFGLPQPGPFLDEDSEDGPLRLR
ncbi:MAG: ATP-binding protein [Planctomycetes bacterium]|nr:ATP-binding protein [Planctomycetota bacterium]